MKDFLIGVLVLSLGWSKKDATAFVDKDENLSTEKLGELSAEFSEFVDTLKKESKEEGYGNATREVLTAKEKELSTKYGINKKVKTLDALVEEIIKAKTPSPENPESISEDTIKKHPLYIKKEEEVEELKTNYETELKGVKEAEVYKETLKGVAKAALKHFDSRSPVLSTNEVNKEKQRGNLVKSLTESGYIFKPVAGTEDDYTIEHKETGKRLEKENGHVMKFSELVDLNADNLGFDFEVSTERTGPESENPKSKVPGAEGEKVKLYKGAKPANQDEFIKLISDQNKPMEEKLEITEDYGKEFGL